MQKQAIQITGFAAVAGAVGFLLRWMQGLQIYDPDTGLARRGAGINFWLIAAIVLTAAGLAVWLWKRRDYILPQGPAALVGRSPLHTVLGSLGALALLLSGLVMVFAAKQYLFPGFRVILGILTMAAALCAVELFVQGGKPGWEKPRQLFSVVLTLLGCFWMVVIYKENAMDPVIWRFAMEVLAVCAATVAFYYITGFHYDACHPLLTIFFCLLGMSLCMICVIDKHVAADALSYGGVAVILGVWGFVLSAKLQSPKESLGIRQ